MQRSQAFKICLLFTALAAAVVGLTFLPVSREGLTIALVLLLGCLCFLPTVLDYLLRRSVDIFEPIHSVCYLSFVSFGLATLYLLYDRQAAYDRRVYPYLNVSLVLVIVGTTTMIYGYFLTRRFNPRRPVPQREVRGAAWIAALFALGVSGQLAGFVAERQLHTVGRVSGLVSLLRQFESFALFGYILLVFLWFSGRATRPQKLVLFSIVLPVESLWMIAHIGGKAVTLTVLGLPLVAFWYAHRRLPRKATMALILLTVFLIFPLYNTFKGIRHRYSLEHGLEKSLGSLGRLTPQQYMETSFHEVGRRLAVINSIAVIIRETGRTVDYQYGRTIYLTGVALAIPRFLWPDKPMINIGREFGREFRILPRWDMTTFLSITSIGELYWNFGLPGVILGMFLIGMGYQLIYQLFGQARDKDPIRLSMYMSLLTTFVSVEDNIAGWVGGTVRVLLIYTALDWALRSMLITRKNPRSGPFLGGEPGLPRAASTIS